MIDRVKKGKKLNDKLSEYTVVDIETTGFSPQKNKIIEIAAVKVKNGKVVDKFQKLVNPEERINYYITNLTGISNDMVSKADKIDSVILEFKEFVGDSVIVGHNVNFDINFLYDNLYNVSGGYLMNDFIDTMYMSKELLPGLSNYKLESLVDHFNFSYEGAHRALNDCIFTYECYEKMKEIM